MLLRKRKGGNPITKRQRKSTIQDQKYLCVMGVMAVSKVRPPAIDEL